MMEHIVALYAVVGGLEVIKPHRVIGFGNGMAHRLAS